MKPKEIKKAARQISCDEIVAVVESEGGPQQYCILREPGDRIGQTFWISRDGTLFDKLDGDEVFEYALIQYLEEHGVRVFESHDAMREFAAELKMKLRAKDVPNGE